VVVHGLVPWLPVGGRALGIGASERQPAGMGCKACTRTLPRVDGAAGPAPGRRVVGEPGARRVEFDVAVAAQDVGLAVDQAGLVATLPARAGSSVSAVEPGDIVATQPLHHPADCACL